MTDQPPEAPAPRTPSARPTPSAPRTPSAPPTPDSGPQPPAKKEPPAKAEPPATPAPHPTSVAVWGVPSPVVAGRPFTATVGVRCASGCRLSGMPVVVRDAAGAAVGEGRLGETPAPGTRALFAAEVSLVAPEAGGVHSRTAAFAGSASPGDAEAAGTGAAAVRDEAGAASRTEAADDGPEAAHAGSSSTFSFRTAGPPDHRVAVTVREQEAGAPVAGAEVRVGLYRAATDAGGLAVLDVPAGEYDVWARKAGYEPRAGRVVVTGDVACRIDVAPASDADDDQVWM